jgi:hypothetical protein
MLVYFQQTKLDDILQKVKDDEIPKHLNRSLKDNAKQLKDDVLNTLISPSSTIIQRQGCTPPPPPQKQKNIQLKKATVETISKAEKRCILM